MGIRSDLYIPSKQEYADFYRGNRRKNRWARLLRLLNKSSLYALVAAVSAFLASTPDSRVAMALMAGYLLVIGIGVGSCIRRLAQ